MEYISEELNGYTALLELERRHRIHDMYMLVMDSNDGNLPYIAPHLFPPTIEAGCLSKDIPPVINFPATIGA